MVVTGRFRESDSEEAGAVFSVERANRDVDRRAEESVRMRKPLDGNDVEVDVKGRPAALLDDEASDGRPIVHVG